VWRGASLAEASAKAGREPDRVRATSERRGIAVTVSRILIRTLTVAAGRVQVCTKHGKYVRELLVAPNTPSRGAIWNPERFGMCGSTYNLTLSHDPGQQYVLVADGTDHRIWIHDRQTGALVGQVGSPGRMAGQFFWIDAIATDSATPTPAKSTAGSARRRSCSRTATVCDGSVH
jgi:hypothetical protein